MAMEDTSITMSLQQKQNMLDTSIFQSICFVLTIIQVILPQFLYISWIMMWFFVLIATCTESVYICLSVFLYAHCLSLS